ncbi:hypothetical protein SAMN02799630_04637 [Paenibacillus sp. UNCCL117]|uniref:hypothetical protein n=1 Tax=unclassified Paenibacillus TaxID=185978 RepID=UPI000888A800|nr:MULTISPECIES: hypothetical protein [unclassified Paenibacillus]SDE07728.1 hypothetical protein SAMN04488602_11858 [Paenibacillus sp. cl123]SFW59111.1 hypothetical protein SAMN02799630_04637 [Paenibacillus sp. UNCCL117]
MTVKHLIKCHGSEVLVREADGSYILSIQSSTNPLGFGSTLETFSDKEEAIQAAEKFCTLLSAAKERGYYLENGYFAKPDKEKLSVKQCLKKELDENGWISELETV